MKRNIFIILTVFALILSVFISFSSKQKTKESETTKITSSEKTSSINEDIKYAPLIPKPEDVFKEGKVTIIVKDGGELYSFRVKNYKDGEYEEYVAKCKEMGFDNIHSESETSGGKMFMAYDKNKKYYLQVFLGYEIEAIDVSCREVTE